MAKWLFEREREREREKRERERERERESEKETVGQELLCFISSGNRYIHSPASFTGGLTRGRLLNPAPNKLPKTT